MTTTNTDERAAGAAGDRELDRLLDLELLDIARPTPVNLRARVMARLDEAPREARSGAVLAWRPAVALASVLVLLAGVSVVFWQAADSGHRDGQASPAAVPSAAYRPAPQGAPAPGEKADGRQVLGTAPVAQVSATPLVAAADSDSHPARRRSRPRFVMVDWPVEETLVSAADDRHLPGVPAGDLGDPIAPMPPRRPIAFAPITAAPLVSELSRPVTDFPASDSLPAEPAGAAGPTGGSRR